MVQKSLHMLKNDLVEIGKRVFARGYVASNDGNFSARIDEERVLITPTGVSKGYMKPEDMAVVDMDGKLLNGMKKPSSEVHMHLKVYSERPDVWGICHAHPVYATGFAVAGIPLDKCILPEVVLALGNIPLIEYGTPGTDEFYAPVVRYLKNHDAFLLANHGALTIGKDPFSAYFKMETLEHFAQIAFVAQQLGHLNVLNKDQVRKLTELRKKFGFTTDVGCVSCEEDNSCNFETPAINYKTDAEGISISKEQLVKTITEEILKEIRK